MVGSKSIFDAQVPTQLQSCSSKMLGIKWSQVGGEENSGQDVGIDKLEIENTNLKYCIIFAKAQIAVAFTTGVFARRL